MTHALAGLLISQSSIVAAIEDEGCYFSSRRLWSAVCDKVILNKRHGMHSAGVFSLHHNARSHVALRSTHLLLEFSWDVFNHLHYNPDLASGDFHRFLHIKKFLFGKRQRFQDGRRRRWVSRSGSNPRRQTFTTQGHKIGPTVWQKSQFRRWMCWKIAQHLLYCSNKSFH